MSKLNVMPRKNTDADTDAWYRQIAQQVNALSECRAAALYQSAQSVPTSGTWAIGDFVPNSNPSELGSGGSKYVIEGWKCLASGTPGTWVQKRFLTGN